ncbi:ABC transporter substrate-binding protein [Berryella wangjianweii]|nr:ABC transporter substrate-binding protein [Berryella wangjianweii]
MAESRGGSDEGAFPMEGGWRSRDMLTTRREALALAALGLGAAATMGMAGCGGVQGATSQPASSASAPAAERRAVTLVDQNDREVAVQVPCERMVVLQHHSLDILCQLGAQERIVGVVDGWRKNLGAYMTTVFPGIEALPQPGGLSSWNVESIAALRPDVVIAAAQAPEDAVRQVAELGIPVVTVTLRGEGKQAEAQNPRLANADAAYTEGCAWALKTLGQLAGAEDKAQAIWDFCMDTRALVDEAVGDISADERLKVAVLANNIAYGNDKYVGCQLLRAGAQNAVALAGVQGNTDFNAELVASWDPDLIITQDRYPADFQTITTDPGYAELRAVREGRVVQAPYWTKPWGNPDTDSIALGELWLAHVLYPQKVDAETVRRKAEDFYERFYGIEFVGTVE